jgi:hypothetical protein
MKILITSSLFHPEIAEPAPYVKKIAELLKKNNEIKILSYSNNPENKERNLIFIKKSDYLIFRIIKFFLKTLKNSKNVDIIYTQTGIASALPSIIAGKIKKIPVIIRFFEDEAYKREKREEEISLEKFYELKKYKIKTKAWLILQKFILKNSKAIITPSKYFKKIIAKKYKIDENKIIVNYDFLNKKYNFPFKIEKKYRLIYVQADNKAKKNIEKIAYYLNNNNYKIIINTEKNKNRKNFKNIKYVNNISKAEDYYYKSKADIFISLTNDKNTINEIIEAASLKTFVIALKNSQNEEIFNKIKFGLLIEKAEQLKNISLEKKELSLKEAEKIFSNKNHIKILTKIFYTLTK